MKMKSLTIVSQSRWNSYIEREEVKMFITYQRPYSTLSVHRYSAGYDRWLIN